MKTIKFLPLFIAALFLTFSCEKEPALDQSGFNSEDLSFIEEEVIADIYSAELLEEADDGIFWGDADFSFLKSGDKNRFKCANWNINLEEGTRVLTLDFSGGDCGKTGTIIIEYLRNEGETKKSKKTITYIDFSHKNEAIFNGTKTIERENGAYSISSSISISKENQEGDALTILRESNREIEWICGPAFSGNNIRKVSGSTTVTKTRNEETSIYSRQIVEPLLMVKDCEMKVQAGMVNIVRADKSEITIDYGSTPDVLSCDAVFECKNTVDVTKNGETITVTVEEGKRIKKGK